MSPPMRTAITSAAAITAKKRNTLTGCLQHGWSRLFAKSCGPEVLKGQSGKGRTNKERAGGNKNERRTQSVVERTRHRHPTEEPSLGDQKPGRHYPSSDVIR